MNKYSPPQDYDDPPLSWLMIALLFLALFLFTVVVLKVNRQIEAEKWEHINSVGMDIHNNNP